jgi:hypothetical protein
MAVMLYAKDRLLTKELSKILTVRAVFLLLLAAAAFLVLFRVIFGDVKGDVQNGVPKNWITVALAFFVSIYCIIIYNNRHTNSYLLFAIFCLCLSVYFGNNRFAWYFNADYSGGRLILKSLLSGLAIFSYLLMLRHFQDRRVIFFSVVSLLILIIGIFIKRLYSAEIVFIGIGSFAVLLVAERINLLNPQKEVAKML